MYYSISIKINVNNFLYHNFKHSSANLLFLPSNCPSPDSPTPGRPLPIRKVLEEPHVKLWGGAGVASCGPGAIAPLRQRLETRQGNSIHIRYWDNVTILGKKQIVDIFNVLLGQGLASSIICLNMKIYIDYCSFNQRHNKAI